MTKEKKYKGYIFLSFLNFFIKTKNTKHGTICAKNFKYFKEEFCTILLSRPMAKDKFCTLLK